MCHTSTKHPPCKVLRTSHRWCCFTAQACAEFFPGKEEGQAPPPPPDQMHTPALTSRCWSRQTPAWTRGVFLWMHLANGTGNSPSPGRPTPAVVKQDKSSGGSVDTTKTRSGPQRVRMSSGEGPIGAAKGRQSDTAPLCQPPPPKTKVTIVRKHEIWNRENLMGPFLGHTLLGPRPPPPPPFRAPLPLTLPAIARPEARAQVHPPRRRNEGPGLWGTTVV